jgi:hypothetical protein
MAAAGCDLPSLGQLAPDEAGAELRYWQFSGN